MTRQRWITAIAAVLLLFLVIYLSRLNARLGAEMADLVEIQVPRAESWWTTTAQCLGDKSPFPRTVRFFTGTRIPATWVQTSDRGKTFGGYTEMSRGFIALQHSSVNDSSLVSHEVWHVLHGAYHPTSIFGDRTHPPRCGLAAP